MEAKVICSRLTLEIKSAGLRWIGICSCINFSEKNRLCSLAMKNKNSHNSRKFQINSKKFYANFDEFAAEFAENAENSTNVLVLLLWIELIYSLLMFRTLKLKKKYY